MTSFSHRPLADTACFDPDGFAAYGYPHETWARMRRETPVAWHDDGIREPFWAVTRYADICTVGKDSDNYLSGGGVSIMRKDQMAAISPSRVPLLLTMDPPEHHKNRMLLRERFKPSVMRALEEHIVVRCREIADEVIARRVASAADGATDGTIDFVDAIAMRLPLDVILELLGVPTSDRDQMYHWSNAVIGSEDPEYGNVDLPREAIVSAQQEMFGYFAKFIAQRRVAPREDLVSLLVEARIGGEPLKDIEILGFCFLLAIAGNETTRNATSGAMLALIEHPQAMAALKADSSQMNVAAEELLRWVTPIIYMARTAAHDVELNGQTIRAGEKVVLFYPSGNRDETVFDEPNVLNLSRKPNRHLTFGFGRHSCLGNDLARIELAAIMSEILRRFPNISLAGKVERLRSNFVGGIKAMPVNLG